MENQLKNLYPCEFLISLSFRCPSIFRAAGAIEGKKLYKYSHNVKNSINNNNNNPRSLNRPLYNQEIFLILLQNEMECANIDFALRFKDLNETSKLYIYGKEVISMCNENEWSEISLVTDTQRKISVEMNASKLSLAFIAKAFIQLWDLNFSWAAHRLVSRGHMETILMNLISDLNEYEISSQRRKKVASANNNEDSDHIRSWTQKRLHLFSELELLLQQTQKAAAIFDRSVTRLRERFTEAIAKWHFNPVLLGEPPISVTHGVEALLRSNAGSALGAPQSLSVSPIDQLFNAATTLSDDFYAILRKSCLVAGEASVSDSSRSSAQQPSTNDTEPTDEVPFTLNTQLLWLQSFETVVRSLSIFLQDIHVTSAIKKQYLDSVSSVCQSIMNVSVQKADSFHWRLWKHEKATWEATVIIINNLSVIFTFS